MVASVLSVVVKMFSFMQSLELHCHGPQSPTPALDTNINPKASADVRNVSVCTSSAGEEEEEVKEHLHMDTQRQSPAGHDNNVTIIIKLINTFFPAYYGHLPHRTRLLTPLWARQQDKCCISWFCPAQLRSAGALQPLGGKAGRASALWRSKSSTGF